MLLGGVFDDVFLPQDRQPAHLAVELPDGQGKLRVVEHGAVKAVVVRVGEF